MSTFTFLFKTTECNPENIFDYFQLDELDPTTTPEIMHALMFKSLGINDLLHFDLILWMLYLPMYSFENFNYFGLNDCGELIKLGRKWHWKRKGEN